MPGPRTTDVIEPRVAIVGGTGVTGGFAFDAAQRLGLEPIAIGRDAVKLDALLDSRGLPSDRRRVADVHDAQALKESLDGVSVVISTVGPYTDLGFPVAQAAAELGLGYTDSSGEGDFVRRVIAEADNLAVETGATLCPGNGVSAFIGDIAMHWITDKRPDSSGALLYDIRNYKPTPGTIESYLRFIIPAGGAVVREGKVGFERLAAFGGRVGGIRGVHGVMPDAMVAARYWPALRFDAMVRAPSRLRFLIEGAMRVLAWSPVRHGVLKLPLERLSRYAAAEDESTATVLAEFTPASGPARRRQLRGRGIYPLTGHLLAITAQAMLLHPGRPAGVRAASEMFTSYEQALEMSCLEEVGPDDPAAPRQ